MKKFILTILLAICVMPLMAHPHHGGPSHHHVGRWDMRYSGHMGWGGPVHHYHGSGSFWGRGGRNFWPGFTGGIIGGIVGGVVAPRSTVVIEQPTIVAPVAVDSVYPSTVVSQPIVVNQTPVQVVQPTIVTPRRWIAGHYEIRSFGDGPTMTSMNIWIPGHWE